jgi:hypothetical protein
VVIGLLAGLAGGWTLATLLDGSPIESPAPDDERASVPEDLRPELRRQEEAFADIAERLEAIEIRLNELARTVAPTVKDREPALPVSGAAPPPRLTGDLPEDPIGGRGDARFRALQAIALDETRPTRDRVLALGELWKIDLGAGTKGSRTPEMVNSVLERLEVEPDPEIRRLICFNVLDALKPWHKPLLIRALEADVEASVRAQAADSLQDLTEDPDVRLALERASRADPSEEVRSTAAEMLRRWLERDR